MKKIALAAAGIAVLAIGGWSAFWYIGKSRIAARLDAEIAALEAQGIDITHGAREIGGFPFGYTVRHRDLAIVGANGIAYHLPEVVTEVTASDMDRLVTTMPEKFDVDFDLPAGGDAAPVRVKIEVESEDLVIVLDGRPGRQQAVSGTAEKVKVMVKETPQSGTAVVDLAGLDYQGLLAGPGGDGLSSGVTKLARIDYAIASETAKGGKLATEGSVDNVQITGRTSLSDQGDIAAILTSGKGTAELVYQTSASRFSMRAEPPEGNRSGTFSGTAASSAGTLAIKDGRVEVAVSSRENALTLDSQPPFPSTDGKPVTVSLRSAEAMYALPVVPTDDPKPFTLRLALDEIVPDAVLWGLLDPAGVMTRDPGRLIVDLAGSARVTQALDAPDPDAAPPIEVGNVSIKSVDLSALGGRIQAAGDVEFLQPMWIPAGQVTVTSTNLLDVIGKLVQGGILAQDVQQLATILGALYARPGDNPGELVSEIRMGTDGITVNGQPVSAGQ